MSRMSLPPAWDNSLVLFSLIITVSCCTFIFLWGEWRGFCFNELITWQITEAFPVPVGSICSFYFCNSEIQLWALGKQLEKCLMITSPDEVLIFSDISFLRLLLHSIFGGSSTLLTIIRGKRAIFGCMPVNEQLKYHSPRNIHTQKFS